MGSEVPRGSGRAWGAQNVCSPTPHPAPPPRPPAHGHFCPCRAARCVGTTTPRPWAPAAGSQAQRPPMRPALSFPPHPAMCGLECVCARRRAARRRTQWKFPLPAAAAAAAAAGKRKAGTGPEPPRGEAVPTPRLSPPGSGPLPGGGCPRPTPCVPPSRPGAARRRPQPPGGRACARRRRRLARAGGGAAEPAQLPAPFKPRSPPARPGVCAAWEPRGQEPPPALPGTRLPPPVAPISGIAAAPSSPPPALPYPHSSRHSQL